MIAIVSVHETFALFIQAHTLPVTQSYLKTKNVTRFVLPKHQTHINIKDYFRLNRNKEFSKMKTYTRIW